ncbi:MAG: hypothetical protein KDB01_25545 [Planctomycetaceae bacterium]|nr:hypothetical protein [Planctomycetaceae bacterium]
MRIFSLFLHAPAARSEEQLREENLKGTFYIPTRIARRRDEVTIQA